MAAANAASEQSTRVVLTAISVTLGVQMLIAFIVHSTGVFGPPITRSLDLSPERVGLYIVIAYVVAMLAGLACQNLMARYGPLRVLQITLVAAATGLAIGAIGTVLTIILSALVIGLAQGLAGPATTVILAARSPRSMFALILSIKQTGVPIGGAIAGAIVPILILGVGWQALLLAMAVLYTGIAFALQPLRASYDAQRDPRTRVSMASAATQMRTALALIWRRKRLRDLSIASFAYVGLQLVVMTYLVSYLHFALQVPLVTAGFVFAVAHGCGIVGRILWGAVGDRFGRGDILLGLLGLLMAAAASIIALSGADWPVAALAGAAAFFGITGVGWNGLFFAEIARSVSTEEVGSATGGSQFFSFFGGIVAPLAASIMLSQGAGYGVVFAVISAVAAMTAINVLLPRRSSAG